MADTPNTYQTNNGSSGTGIAFIVGALVALVAIIGYFVLAEPQNDEINIRVDVPESVQRAGDAAADAAAGAANAVENAAEGMAAAIDRATE
ncbi:MAG: hypothetical protein KDK12_02825 [Rhodobacteraceae bacterium]|nr:hypothetical protein [Paracoccaceae bacterium]